jgi:hypothetical protein
MASDDEKKDDRKHEEQSGYEWDFSEQASDGKRGVTDALKKLFTVGMGAAFMTEDAIRTYLAELKLPKEVMSYLLQGARKSKEELTNRVGNEIVGIIRKIDVVQEASRFVETHKFKISAEIEVVRRDKNGSTENSGQKPSVKVTL